MANPKKKETQRKLTREEKKQLKAIIERTNEKGKKPYTAQATIPYLRMWPDGVCQVTENHFTKTIQFQDINYQLAQNEDKTAIFEGWCDFLNYFDASIQFQFSFLNLAANAETFEQSVMIPYKEDGFDNIREEYADMLHNQLTKGNNGLTKTKFITFGIDADSIRTAKPRLERVEIDLLNNFKRLGVAAEALDGKSRLQLLHGIFHMDTQENFMFEWRWLPLTGLSTKELNQIQNVIAEQPLATKMQPERGKGGKTIFGRYLEAKNGKDIQVQLGENVHFDRDGVTIKASIDGEVMLVNGKITVEPIKVLDAVNVKTGDIKFVGTVVIKGSVEEGYKVEATNIEVNGIVDKSVLEATGNIIVRQGVFGKGEGFIKAGKSLWAKFINDTTVEVEENVIVSDSIVNSNITAMKNIVLRGKKAQIIGGHLLATEEICARKVGSPGGGTETILEVGIDPRAKKRLLELQKNQTDSTRDYENNELDIQNLEQQKKLRKKLPQEKEEKLAALKNKNKQIGEELQEMTNEIDKIQAHLRELKAVGKVKVEETVYAGVKIYVRDVLDEVKMDTKHVTFYYDKSFSKRGDYEPPSLVEEQPDGYSAD